MTNYIENNEIDPTVKLEAAKLEIQKKITQSKLLLKQQQKDLRNIEKLDIEVIADKNIRKKVATDEISLTLNTITELESDLKALNHSREDQNEDEIQAALHQVSTLMTKDQSMAYVIDDQKFIYIDDYATSPKKQNIQIRQLEANKFVELLANELKVKSWHLPAHRLKNLFNEMKRTYQLTRFSIDDSHWQYDKVYLPIQHMRPYFIDQLQVDETSDYVINCFNTLMYSLSGGKKENQDHIEKWIIHKIINYKKATTTPDLVIVGHVGGNGKGIIQAIIRMMLPAILSGKANAKTLNGNFNAIMIGKLIVFFDDQNTKEIPLEVVKQLAGSDTMIIEMKGKDQYEGEKTHSGAWFSNTLPFKLTPGGQEGGVDRRFSIMRTNITYLESIIENEKTMFNRDITMEDAKDMAEVIVSNVFLDRTNIAQWFQHLRSKHPEVDENYTLKPLHGEDYKYFLEIQEDSMDVIFKKLVKPVLHSGGSVPIFVVKELLRHMEGREIGEKTIVTKLKELSVTNKIEVELERLYIEITPQLNTGSKKQCSVLRPKSNQDFTNRTFDWSQVSNGKYPGTVPAGTDLITEDSFIFGVNDDVDLDDIE